MLRNMSGTQRYALFVLVVVVVVVVYLFVSGSFNELTGGDDQTPSAADDTATAVVASTAVALGATELVGVVQVTIEGVTFPDRIRAESRWRSPAQRFAAVRLTMTNRAQQAVSLPLDGLQLVTVDGRAYLADAVLSLGAARSAGGVVYAPPLTLQPQLTITVIAVYDIPLDASGLRLRVHGGWEEFELFE